MMPKPPEADGKYTFVLNKTLDELGPRLGGDAILIYLRLLRYANSDGLAWPSTPRIARETGVHKTTVIRKMKLLREVGLVQKEQKNGKTFWRVFRQPGSTKRPGPVAESDQPGSTKRPELYPRNYTQGTIPKERAISLADEEMVIALADETGLDSGLASSRTTLRKRAAEFVSNGYTADDVRGLPPFRGKGVRMLPQVAEDLGRERKLRNGKSASHLPNGKSSKGPMQIGGGNGRGLESHHAG